MAERVYAFESLARDAAGSAGGAGVVIAPLRPRAMINLRGADELANAAVRQALRMPLPLEPNTTAASADRSVRALWLGPDEWLVVQNGDSAAIEPTAALRVTDVSHGRAALRLRGRSVREALAKGCPIDLDVRVFAPGRCAQTAIGRVSVILDHVERDVFDVYCSRSYAGSVWHWLIEACTEYRYTIAPPE